MPAHVRQNIGSRIKMPFSELNFSFINQASETPITDFSHCKTRTTSVRALLTVINEDDFHFICSLSAIIYHMKAVLFVEISISAAQQAYCNFWLSHALGPLVWHISSYFAWGPSFTSKHWTLTPAAAMPLHHLNSPTAASTIESGWDWKQIVRHFSIELEILLLKDRLH